MPRVKRVPASFPLPIALDSARRLRCIGGRFWSPCVCGFWK